MKRPSPAIIIISLGIATSVAVFDSEKPRQTTSPTADIVPAPSAPAGYRVEIDPATREFVEPTPRDVTANDYPVELQEALSQSSDGLQTVDAPRGGGKMVNLQGRFQNTYVATIGAEGKLVAECDVSHETETEEE